MKFSHLTLLAVFFASSSGAAPTPAQTLCETFDPAPDHFVELYRQGKELGRAICMSFGENELPDRLKPQFVAFANSARQLAAEAFSSTEFADAMALVMQEFARLAEAGVQKNNLPSFITIPDPQNFDAAFFRFDTLNEAGLADLNDAGCAQSGGASCEALFDSLKVAIEQYKKPYVNISARDLVERAGKLMTEWDRYFEEARAQTLLDTWLTTALAQDHLAQSRLVGPMEKQWFALHPSIVVENVSAAVDGEELSEAIAIEWIGLNWWDAASSPIGYPFGISLTSVYSDRVDVAETGHSLMLHFGNSMSIGVTDHDGDAGVFVTVELLGLMAKKKQHWVSYREEIKTIIEHEKARLPD